MKIALPRSGLLFFVVFIWSIFCVSLDAAAWGEGWSNVSDDTIPDSGGGSYSTPSAAGFDSAFSICDISYNGSTVDGVSFGSMGDITQTAFGDSSSGFSIAAVGTGEGSLQRLQVSTYARVTLNEDWTDPDTSSVVSAGSVLYINTKDISAVEITTTLGSGDPSAAKVQLSNGDEVWGYMKEYSDGFAGIGNHDKTLLSEQDMDSVYRQSICPRSYTQSNAVLEAKVGGGYDNLTEAQKAEWNVIYSSASAGGVKTWWDDSGDAAKSYNNLLGEYCSSTSSAISRSFKGNSVSFKAIEFISGVLSDDPASGETYIFRSSGVFTSYQVETQVKVNNKEYTYILPNLWKE